RNYPNDIIRIILPGIDTVKLTFSLEHGYSLYSVEFNNQEHFRVPYKPTIGKSKEIGWFKKLLRKRMDIGAKATKMIVPKQYEDDVDTIFSSNTVVGGIRKKLFKSPSEVKDELAAINSDESNQENKEQLEKSNWLRRVWDTICFWRK
ncbi:MAG: hypothetical protein ACI4TU_10410, partial [Candidatus Cryptobacteroides sp.]